MISIEKLNIIRKERKVSVVKLARYMDLSRQQCTNLLNGDSKISLEQFVKMCDFIGIDTNFTFL